MEDPHAILGVPPGASPDELLAAYRALAKQLHPDVRGDHAGDQQMAEVNAAYDALRNGRGAHRPGAGGRPAQNGPAPRAARVAHWLPEATRRQLGRELLGALESREPVLLVTAAATWASPRALLVVTDRRLLWLLDDAVMHRVRALRYRDLSTAEVRLAWPRRRWARLRLRGRNGHRHDFSHLRPEVAARIVRLANHGRAPDSPRP